MAVERTFSIIKPDATRRDLTGKINARFEEKGLRIVAQKRLWMSRQQAEQFYGVHKARPFFNDLCTFMTSGPVVVQVLEGEGAVAKNREIMGATNPANADAGTIRKDFAESIEANSVHGSDSPENAAIEMAYFFAGTEIVGCVFAITTKKRPARAAFFMRASRDEAQPSPEQGETDQQGDRAANAQQYPDDRQVSDQTQRHRRQQQYDPEDHECNELVEPLVGFEM